MYQCFIQLYCWIIDFIGAFSSIFPTCETMLRLVPGGLLKNENVRNYCKIEIQMQLWRTDDQMYREDRKKTKSKMIKCSFYGLKPTKYFLFVCILLCMKYFISFVLYKQTQEIVRMQFEIYFLRLSLHSDNPSIQWNQLEKIYRETLKEINKMEKRKNEWKFSCYVLH